MQPCLEATDDFWRPLQSRELALRLASSQEACVLIQGSHRLGQLDPVAGVFHLSPYLTGLFRG